jgi:hypothetical protein
VQVPRAPIPGIPNLLNASSRTRRLGGALAAIGAVALAIGIIVGAGLPGSSSGASTPKAGSGATTVQYRNLVATDTESGTLSYANPATVFNRLSGTITYLPAVGALIKPGQTLYDVSGAPVVLFNGTTPAYRDLTSGVTNGADVLELNRDLVALGFDPDHQITINNTWQSGTTSAVEAWQNSLGETETGTITLGQVVFLPGPQRITSVQALLGSTGASGGAASSATTTTASLEPSPSGGSSLADTGPTAPHTEFVSFTTRSVPAASSATSTAAVAPCAAAGPSTSTSTTPSPTCKTPLVTDTPTTPTTPTTTTPTTPTTTTPSKKPSNPSEEAVLLALLKAETLALKKQLSSSSTSASGRSSAGGTTSAAASGASRSGGSGGGGGASSGGSSSATGGSSSASGGSSAGGTATAILQTTSNQSIVVVNLDASKQSEAVVGEPVTVQMPNGNTINGKITQVSPVAQTSTSSSSGSASGSGGGGSSSSSTATATIPVTITLGGNQSLNGLDQAAVSVNFAQQVENHVLSVPVTALLATAGGGYAVQEAVAPHTLIPVTPGLFATGFVQISGANIYPGLQVTDSQG